MKHGLKPVETSAYSLLVLSMYNTSKIVAGIETAAKLGELTEIGAILAITKSNPGVPAFNHPMVVDLPGYGERVVVDLRNYVSQRHGDDGYSVRAHNDYRLALLRGKLQHIWAFGDPYDFVGTGTLPLRLYSSWIADALVARMDLRPEDRMSLVMAAGAFYLRVLHQSPNEMHGEALDEMQIMRMATQLSKATNISVEEIISSNVFGGNIAWDLKALVAHLKRFCKNQRMESLDAGAFVTMVTGGTMLGYTNYRELLMVGLVHTPTWVALVADALVSYTQGAIKKSTFAPTLQYAARKGEDGQFTKALNSLIANYKV